MSYNKAVDFYAGNMDVRTGVTFTHNSSERILAYAKNRGVKYFVVDERYYGKFPVIKKWVTKNPPEELKLIYNVSRVNEPKVWIYVWKNFKGNLD